MKYITGRPYDMIKLYMNTGRPYDTVCASWERGERISPYGAAVLAHGLGARHGGSHGYREQQGCWRGRRRARSHACPHLVARVRVWGSVCTHVARLQRSMKEEQQYTSPAGLHRYRCWGVVWLSGKSCTLLPEMSGQKRDCFSVCPLCEVEQETNYSTRC